MSILQEIKESDAIGDSKMSIITKNGERKLTTQSQVFLLAIIKNDLLLPIEFVSGEEIINTFYDKKSHVLVDNEKIDKYRIIPVFIINGISSFRIVREIGQTWQSGLNMYLSTIHDLTYLLYIDNEEYILFILNCILRVIMAAKSYITFLKSELGSIYGYDSYYDDTSLIFMDHITEEKILKATETILKQKNQRLWRLYICVMINPILNKFCKNKIFYDNTIIRIQRRIKHYKLTNKYNMTWTHEDSVNYIHNVLSKIMEIKKEIVIEFYDKIMIQKSTESNIIIKIVSDRKKINTSKIEIVGHDNKNNEITYKISSIDGKYSSIALDKPGVYLIMPKEKSETVCKISSSTKQLQRSYTSTGKLLVGGKEELNRISPLNLHKITQLILLKTRKYKIIQDNICIYKDENADKPIIIEFSTKDFSIKFEGMEKIKKYIGNKLLRKFY